jgi:hypothetical protein
MDKKMKMKKIFILFSLVLIFACNNKEKSEEQSSIVIKDVQTILPMELDTKWSKSDLTNAANPFDRDTLFKAIIKGIFTGKLTAYENYPDKNLSITEVKNLLSSWDSTNLVEDPSNPETFYVAPVKSELSGYDVPFIKFHEDITLDTLTFKIKRKISYVTLFQYENTLVSHGENAVRAVVAGTKKLFDVKLNE